MVRWACLTSALVVAAVWLSAAGGCGSAKVEMPTSYETWNAKDGTFQLQYPANWEADGGGRQGIQWAKFLSGGALFRVDTEVSGGLVGDIAGSGMPGMDTDLPEELAPVATVHEMKADALAVDYGAYKEEAPVKFVSALGEGRKSAFSGSQGLGTKVRGYRATILGHEKAIRIVCTCPEKTWGQVQPVFDKMLDSFGQGVPER